MIVGQQVTVRTNRWSIFGARVIVGTIVELVDYDLARLAIVEAHGARLNIFYAERKKKSDDWKPITA